MIRCKTLQSPLFCALLASSLIACAQESSFKGSAKQGATAEKTADATPDVVKTRLVESSYQQTATNGLADILIVMDDSGSMKPYQTNLSTKLNDLLTELKDSDWQIGVITTTVDSPGGVDSCDLSLIRSSDPDREEKFRIAVTPGTNGSGDEQGLRQALNGLNCQDKKWIRDNATVAVLFVTGEEDASFEPEWKIAKKSNPPAVQSDAMAPLLDYVERDLGREIGTNAGFYAIYSPAANPCDSKYGSTVGNKYQKLLSYKNASPDAHSGRICETSYKPTLEMISKSIAQLVTSSHQLADAPLSGTVVITGTKADGSALSPADYKINGSVVSFNKGSEPAVGSTVKLSYRVAD